MLLQGISQGTLPFQGRHAGEVSRMNSLKSDCLVEHRNSIDMWLRFASQERVLLCCGNKSLETLQE